MHPLGLAVGLVTLLLTYVAAHPGHDTRQEVEQHSAYIQHRKRDLTHCGAKIKARGLEARSVARRHASVESARAKRGISFDEPQLKARNISTILNTTHLSDVEYSPGEPESTVFASNGSCILFVETTQGPYYASGEYVRDNIVETQKGVELVVDTQVLDMNTCEPVTNGMLELWRKSLHANATGVYSGIVTSGNGDSNDVANINKTFLRGIQPTDKDGVVQFHTIFPGHYDGRSNHLHVLLHLNATTLSNKTIHGGTIAHVGQLFFDQDLIDQVEATYPYSLNTQVKTYNYNDTVLIGAGVTNDPVVEYSLLGRTVAEGIFAWISFGVDLSDNFTITPSAEFGEGGGTEIEIGYPTGTPPPGAPP